MNCLTLPNLKLEGGREEGREGGREEGRKGGREEGRKGGREEGSYGRRGIQRLSLSWNVKYNFTKNG